MNTFHNFHLLVVLIDGKFCNKIYKTIGNFIQFALSMENLVDISEPQVPPNEQEDQ